MQRHASKMETHESITPFLESLFDLAPAERKGNASVFRDRFTKVVQEMMFADKYKSERQVWANQSYCHANGFVKLVAFVTPCERFRLRVHVWPGDFNSQRVNVHNHRYSFVSFVNKGSIEDYSWETSLDGSSFNRFSYKPRNDDGYYFHEHTGSVNLRVRNVRMFQEGELYSLDSGELHYTIPSLGISPVTFFAEDRRSLKTEALTYSQYHDVEERSTYVPPVSMAQYMELLKTHVIQCSDR